VPDCTSTPPISVIVWVTCGPHSIARDMPLLQSGGQCSASRSWMTTLIEVVNTRRDRRFRVRHDLSDRQLRIVLAGGVINDFRRRATPA
jgi:hypothetical protein